MAILRTRLYLQSSTYLPEYVLLTGVHLPYYILQALLKDPDEAEFCIVSIPTALSLNESERLLAALREQAILNSKF